MPPGFGHMHHRVSVSGGGGRGGCDVVVPVPRSPSLSSPATTEKMKQAHSSSRTRRRGLLLSLGPLVYAIVLLCQQHKASTLPDHKNNDDPFDLSQCPPWHNTNTTTSTSTSTSSLRPSSLPPIWVPSYPGSGSELFRDLIQAWTGRPAHDVYFDEVCQGGVTCKTHWPALPGREPHELATQRTNNHNHNQPYRFDTSKAFLLLRYPAAAIPSFHNFLYEVNHHIPDHSQQAPQEAWIEWRDRRFDRDLQRWVNVIRTWYGPETTPQRITLLLPYEDLVAGPQRVRDVYEQLRAVGHTDLLDLSSMRCAWKRVVLDRPGKKRANRGYTPRFTASQYHQMRDALVQLQTDLGTHETDLAMWLQRYQRQVERDLAVVAAEQTSIAAENVPRS